MLCRGAFIAIEGGDKTGKSYQSKILVENLMKRNIRANLKNFPNRSSETGKILDNFLQKRIELETHAASLLFTANRWEAVKEIRDQLFNGTSLITDRFSSSGIAFSAPQNGFIWSRNLEVGLPKPDLTIFIYLNSKDAAKREGFGEEKYEVQSYQDEVNKNFEKLQDSSWITINGNQNKEIIERQILDETLNVIDKCKNLPLEFFSID